MSERSEMSGFDHHQSCVLWYGEAQAQPSEALLQCSHMWG